MIRTMLITGASSGIGAAVARELARQGWHLALSARRQDELEALATELRAQYPALRISVHVHDVTDYPESDALIASAAEALGGLGAVFVNAGIGLGGRIGGKTFDKQRCTIETNLLGAMAITDAAVRHFRAQGGGQVIGTCSVAAFRAMPGNVAYSVSKIGFATYLEGLRAEGWRDNIRVTVLYPGFVKTPIVEGVPRTPFAIAADRAAVLIVRAIERQTPSVIVPRWPWMLARWAMPWIPARLMARAGF
ncbi:SDR family NAD(P)-dependent oxidoreductase [Candidatus Macondimonas diazotrophica]|jgi:short-subunit dehydrogenase|nr:SDR family NAD(P)-dependent oxidoreductase [Candidatus Macondimonas diazotrophica]NCU00470.1 SDR family NAD(P)-dependent oxidoreductase [Candidatus Macondimonas diazotrophica]